MAWRESFNVQPMVHSNPIPTASRTGNMLFTSVIGGRDLESGKVPDSAADQAENCFKILAKILETAGAKPTDVAYVGVVIKEPGTRELVNKPWVAMFPDEHSRPARHTSISSDLGGHVQIEAVCVIEGK